MGADDRAEEVNFNNRKCRDIFWLLLFVVFVLGMFIIAGYAYSEGDYRRVTNGMDYRGCICGTEMTYDAATDTCSDTPGSTRLGSKTTFVQFLDPNRGSGLYVMCTTECATNTVQMYCADASATNGVLVPSGDTLSDQYDSIVASRADCSNSGCAWIRNNCALSYKSTSQFGYCLPIDNTTFIEFADSFLGDQGWTTAWSSVEKGGWVIVGCTIFSVIIAFVYMKLMECLAKPITYLALIAIFVATVLGGVFLLSGAKTIQDSYSGGNADGYKDDVNWQLNFYGAIATFVVAGLYALIVCCMLRRIAMAIRCVELAGDAISAQRCIVTIPGVLTALGIGIFAVWCVTAVYLFSSGTVEAASFEGVPNGVYKKFTFNRELQYAGLYHLFGLFWTTQFVLAFGEIVIAYAVVQWFFAEIVDAERKMPRNPLATAVGRVLKYHLGSIALGSLIIAFVKLVRAFLEYIKAKGGAKAKENRFWKMIMCCCSCCMWCVEKILRFLNNQAYIQIALSGDSFCTSAGKAFWLVARNLSTVGSLKVIATGFVVLGKLFIMACSGALCYAILTQVDTFSNQTLETAVPNAFIPAILVCLLTYFVGAMFMSVYSQTIETILMCFIHDKEATGGRHSTAELSNTVSKLNKSAGEGGAEDSKATNAVGLV